MDDKGIFAKLLRNELLQADISQARARIHAFVEDKQAENLYIDFVEKSNRQTAALSEDDKRNFAKALSGFAHSDGGLLVWGIRARQSKNPDTPDVATELASICHVRAFHAALNTLVSKATKPVVEGVENVLVFESPQEDTGYVLTFVPPGANPPYRAEWCNNQFYKRAGSSFYPMEPFDVRDVIQRFSYPKVSLKFRRTDVRRLPDEHLYHLDIEIANAGPGIVETWKLEIYLPKVLEPESPHQPNGFFRATTRVDNRNFERSTYRSHLAQMRGMAMVPIFPGESIALTGEAAPLRIFYRITTPVYRESLPLAILWRFFTANGPMLEGQILIKASYEPQEEIFCVF